MALDINLLASFGNNYFYTSHRDSLYTTNGGDYANVCINGVYGHRSNSNFRRGYLIGPSVYLYHVYIDNNIKKKYWILGHPNPIFIDYVTIDYDPLESQEEEYTNNPDKLITNNISFELLRANPKLTGNVKVVVDSSSNLYLDTFKVSKGLSQRKYRKIKLNPDEYYGNALMSYMSSLSSDDFYKIEEGCYDLFAIANNLGEEYYDVYNSGARTNTDKMYNENYSILAPLCIKKTIPDFFLIFKVKGYESCPDAASKIKYFLENGTLVKSFDLRKDSNIGKMIRKTYEHAREFVGDIFVSYEYEGDNLYNGISLDRGVVSRIYESASPERDIKNQVAMNDWYTLGFERNRIVSKNIINFEFMFDDTDEDLFSINTYFGLYVRLNGEESDYSCIDFNNNRPVFNSSVNEGSFNPLNYKDVIYGISLVDRFERLTEFPITSAGAYSMLQEYARKPYKNIISPSLINLKSIDSAIYSKSFASVKINTLTDVGEHFRVIAEYTDANNNQIHNIFEVVMSNAQNNEFDISEVNEYDDINGYRIRRITVYNTKYRSSVLSDPNITENEIAELRKQQISYITEAFNSFGTDEISAHDSDDSFTIIYGRSNTQDTIIIEKVCSFVGAVSDPSTADEYEDDSAYIFNDSNVKKLILNPTDSGDKKIFYPSGFEVLETRIAYAYSFIPFSNGNSLAYMFDEDTELAISREKTVIFKHVENPSDPSTYIGQYTLTKKFEIKPVDGFTNNNINFGSQEIWNVPGFGLGNGYIMMLEREPKIINGKARFYNTYPINSGICSIFPVRELAGSVIDNENKISANREDYISLTGGEFSSTDNVFGKQLLTRSEESIMHYIDKFERVTTYTNPANGQIINFDNISNENRSLYLTSLSDNNHKRSDISLTCPYCCKWKVVGTDARGEDMRVMYDYAPDSSNVSYFIPDDNDGYIGAITVADTSVYVGNLRYDASTKGYSKYINSKLDSRTHLTFRKFLFEDIGKIEDILTNNDFTYGKMSSVYTIGDNAIEFVSNGLKLRINSNNTNILDVSEYNGYSAILVCCAGNNPKRLNPCEILIDEQNEQIAVIIYNGSAPWEMIYNDYNAKRIVDGSIALPSVYPVFHKSSISDCMTTWANGTKNVLFSDDSSMWGHDASLTIKVKGFGVFMSPEYNVSSFIRDKSAYVYGEISSDSYDEQYKDDSISINDASVVVNSIKQRPNLSIFSNDLVKPNEYIDLFVVAGIPDSSIWGKISDSLTTDYATLPLWLVKTLLSSATMTVKTQNGTNDYSTINGLFDLRIIDPIDVVRENSDFEKLNEDEPLHSYQCYAEPVTRDILTFEYKNDSSDYLNHCFNKSLDGCNIHVKDVNDIEQLWIKKYSTESLIHPADPYIYVYETLVLFSGIDTSIDYEISKNSIISDTNSNVLTVTNTDLLNKTTIFKLKDSSSFGQDFSIKTDSSMLIDNIEYRIKSVDSSSILPDSNQQQHYVFAQITTYGYNDIVFTQNSIIECLVTNGVTDSSVKFHPDLTFPIKHNQKGHISAIVDSGSAPTNQSMPLQINGAPFDAVVASVQHPRVKKKNPQRDSVVSTGLSIIHNFSPIMDNWNTDIYRTYTNMDDWQSQTGAQCGYEKNMFFASHGINLKTKNQDDEILDYIEITDWKNSKINRLQKTLVLDVTESLIYKIMYSDGYLASWINQITTNADSKRKYIENNILPIISINDKCPFEIWEDTAGQIVFPASQSTRFGAKIVKLNNVTNTLYTENNKYYMRIEGLKNTKYSAKMKIKL